MKTRQIALILAALVLLSSFASAGFFSDIWDSITGNAFVFGRPATKPVVEDAKGLLQQMDNQAKELAKSKYFASNAKAQAAISQISKDISELKKLAESKDKGKERSAAAAALR